MFSLDCPGLRLNKIRKDTKLDNRKIGSSRVLKQTSKGTNICQNGKWGNNKLESKLVTNITYKILFFFNVKN